MCACQLVNVFDVLSREYPRDYVFIGVCSALRNFVVVIVLYVHHLDCSFGVLRIHALKFAFCIHCNHHTT